MRPEAIADMVGTLIPSDGGVIVLLPGSTPAEATAAVQTVLSSRGYKAVAIADNDVEDVSRRHPNDIVVAAAAVTLNETPPSPGISLPAPQYVLPVDRDALAFAVERALRVFPLAEGGSTERFTSVMWEMLDAALATS